MDTMLTTLGTVAKVIAKSQNARRRLMEKRRRLLHIDIVENADEETNDAANSVLEVLQNFGKVAASSMIPGQFPQSQSSDYFNMQYGSYEVDSSSSSIDTCEKYVSMELPLSVREKALGYSSNSMLVPACRKDTTSTNLAATSISSDLYGDEIAEKFDSNPLSLHLSSFPCNDDDADNCKVAIVLPRTLSSGSGTTARRLQRGLQSSSDEETVSIDCDKSFVGDVTHLCLNGLTVSVACDGTEYTVETKCPIQYDEPSCTMLEGTVAAENRRCRMMNYTDTNITCLCSLLPPSFGRRLQSTSTTTSTSAPDGEYSVNYVSMLVSMTKTFEQTILSADDLDVNTIKKGWQAFVVVGTFAFVMLGWIAFAHYLDAIAAAELDLANKKESQRKELASSLGKLHRRLSQLFSGVAKGDEVAEHEENASNPQNNVVFSSNAFLSFAERALPQILGSRGLMYRCKGELKRHHRWAGVLFHFSKKFPRALRVVSLATNIIIMLFIQSITYDLTKGDDGSCGRLHSESTCLEPNSAYQTGAPKCYWVADATTEHGGDCHFVEADSDVKVIIFVAVFSAVLSTPIAMGANWVIQNVLAAPTLSAGMLKKLKKVAAHPADRQMTGVLPVADRQPRRAENQLKSMLSSDIQQLEILAKSRRAYESLCKDLKLYYAAITDNHLRREFATAWGLDDYGDFLRRESEVVPSSAAGRGSDQGFFSSLAKRLSCATKAGNDMVRSELIEIERNLKVEKMRFEQEFTSEKAKNMRLLYLFQKDLMPGITGQILENQGNRENKFVAGVSLRAKQVSWFGLFLLDAGMLFYIFLFAVSQDPHRQTAWAKSFATWLIVEIVVVSSLVVLFMHVLVPSVVMRDVSKIKKRLLHSLQQYHQKMQSGDLKSDVAKRTGDDGDEDSDESADEESIKKPEDFNAASYLFVSYKMATRFSDLKVAKVIREFHTAWPKQSYQRTTDVSKGYNSRFKAFSTAGGTIAMFFLTSLLSMPVNVQDLVMQMAMTVVTGGIMVLHVDLFNLHPALIIVPILVILALMAIVYVVFFHKSATKVVAHDDSMEVAAAIDVLATENQKQKVSREIIKTPFMEPPVFSVPVPEPAPVSAPTVPKNYVNQRQSVIQGVNIAKQAHVAAGITAILPDIESGGRVSEVASSMPKNKSSEGNVSSGVLSFDEASFQSLNIMDLNSDEDVRAAPSNAGSKAKVSSNSSKGIAMIMESDDGDLDDFLLSEESGLDEE
jgi:hypothetical protein